MVNINWSCAECGRTGKCSTVETAMVIHSAVSPKCSVIGQEYVNVRPDQSIVFERKKPG